MRAVEQEDSIAMGNLGALYHLKLMDYKKAEKYYIMAVNKGNVDAMRNLGYFYTYTVKNYQKAEEYFIMAIKGCLN